jgi:hypothetical protein
MADACDMWLTITGPAASRTQLLEEVGGHDEDGQWIPIDFEKVLPIGTTGDNDEIVSRQLATWGAYGAPNAHESIILEEEGDADQTVVRLATGYAPPIPIFSTLAARYPGLEFELIYLLEQTAGAGHVRWTDGRQEHEEVAAGVDATLTLLDRIRPELADSEREAYGH